MRRHTSALLFMHIPKTAGTSLRAALANAYLPDERVFIYPPADMPGAVSHRDFIAQPPESKAGLRLVVGHLPFGVHESMPLPSDYVTVLREPVARIASLYAMYRKTRPDWLKGMQLAEWALSGLVLQTDNEMVRQLTGWPRHRFGECPDSLLQEALENIKQHFVAVLSTDNLAAAHEVLTQVTGRPIPPLKRLNVGPAGGLPAAVSPDDRRRIEELNRLDLLLYEQCRRLNLPRARGRLLSAPRRSIGARWRNYAARRLG